RPETSAPAVVEGVAMFVRTTKIGRRLVPALIALALTVTVYGTVSQAAADSDAMDCLNEAERELLDLINDYREDHGLRRLRVAEDLNEAAYLRSKGMDENGFFDHTNLDGEAPEDRMDDRGYDTDGSTGENIAAGYWSPEEVFEAWRSSPSHDRNLL